MTANADLSCEYTATLTFNMGGKDTQISEQNFEEGSKAEEPAYPQKPANPDSPSTGDTSYIMLWAVVLLMSGSGVVFLTVKKKAK